MALILSHLNPKYNSKSFYANMSTLYFISCRLNNLINGCYPKKFPEIRVHWN